MPEGVVDEIADRLAGSPLITPAVARRIRLEFIRSGYDGIIVHDAGGDGIDYVIALLARTVRIVEP